VNILEFVATQSVETEKKHILTCRHDDTKAGMLDAFAAVKDRFCLGYRGCYRRTGSPELFGIAHLGDPWAQLAH